MLTCRARLAGCIQKKVASSDVTLLSVHGIPCAPCRIWDTQLRTGAPPKQSLVHAAKLQQNKYPGPHSFTRFLLLLYKGNLLNQFYYNFL